MKIFTIGHSTRSADEFLALLRPFGIGRLVDVRRYPGSRKHPHFSRTSLERTLAATGIEYVHAPELGGRRSGKSGSPNDAWRSASFRAYADHMASPEFQVWLNRLIEYASGDDTVVMCAEAMPWRCHRQLIADALVTRGTTVSHIMGVRRTAEHELNPHAVVSDDGILVYPARRDDDGQPSLF